MTPTTSLPAVVTVAGEKWRLHSVAFRHKGSTWTTHLYARSWEEAESMLESLKETGKVEGEVEGWAQGDVPISAVDALVRATSEPGGGS